MYLDLIRSHLQDTSEVLKDAMNLLGFEYQSEFARRNVAEGKAEGKAEGRVEIILEQLATRFGTLPDSIQTRVRSANAAQLHAVAKLVLTAQTLEEALSSL